MAIGDVSPVTTGACEDLYYVDTGMYDTEGYGSVYLLDADEPTLVDTGIGTNHERVLGLLEAVGVARDDLANVVVTHVHLDHAGGAGVLAEACEQATVYVHERGARHLIDPERLWEGTKGAVGDQIEFYTEPEPVPEARVETLADGDSVDCGDRVLVAHEVPGHAPHQHAFELPSMDAVFTADAAGIYVPDWDTVRETTPPPQFDCEQALDDVDTLAALEPETLLYSHFGPAPAADRLDEYTEVLSEWVVDVQAARDRLDDDDAVVEEFVAAADTDAIWGERKAAAETAMNVRGVLGYLDHRSA